MESIEFRINSTVELIRVAQFLASVRSSSIFLFKGEMGAGKTTLIRAVCKELGVTDEVSSPTFSLINHYRTTTNLDVFHFDFYRINDIREALDMGVEEYLESGAICLIEWPEKIMQLLSGGCVVVEIEAVESVRIIKVHLQP